MPIEEILGSSQDALSVFLFAVKGEIFKMRGGVDVS